jgi:hypothetical protein
VLVYQVENQGCAYWGVLLKDLEQDDPPTVTRLDGPGAEWEPWEPRLSVACVATVMSEVVLLDDGPTDYVELEEGTDLGREFRRLPDVGRETRWFAGPDVLIREIAEGVRQRPGAYQGGPGRRPRGRARGLAGGLTARHGRRRPVAAPRATATPAGTRPGGPLRLTSATPPSPEGG